MKKNVNDTIIIGGGGNSSVLIEICDKIENLKIIGYTDVEDKGDILGIPYIGKEDTIDMSKKNVIIGLSYLKTPKDRSLRLKLISDFSIKKCLFPIVKSRSSIISKNVFIGVGTLIYEQVVVNVNTRIGSHSILNTSSIVEHDCVIENNFFLGPNSTICGNVKIGKNVFVGAGTVIQDDLNIVDNVVIGAGSVVTKSIFKEGLYYGNPAKFISKI